MKQATRERLNALNLRFYERHAGEFSRTRERAWGGSTRALELAERALRSRTHGERVRVLDVGCGNGRLLPALRARFAGALDYTGVDASAALLAIARRRHETATARFAQADFVARAPEKALPSGPFELVALFGVLHHVPAEAERVALLRAAARRLAPAGVVAFTLWRFDGDRFARKRLAPAELAAHGLADAELEPGDHLLRWRERGVRYCHLCSDEEIARLCAAPDLPQLARFRADGEGDRLNEYVLCGG